MFTQCPSCQTTFRVTADVLRQAAGKVRCGGCGAAFNALNYLSEKKPGSRSATPLPPPVDARSTPEDTDTLPEAVTPEQSEALLKTLDELAGADVRIEDTGTEWEVRGDGEKDEPTREVEMSGETGSIRWFFDDRAPAAAGSSGDVGEMPEVFDARERTPIDADLDEDVGPGIVDEVLEASDTPIDEVLDETPGAVESAEIFTPDALAADEMRFDDNTPLPEDFGLEPERELPAPVVEAREAPVAAADSGIDVPLVDPGDWEQLLDEVGEPKLREPAEAGDVRLPFPGPDLPFPPDADEESGELTLEEELLALPDIVEADFEVDPADDRASDDGFELLGGIDVDHDVSELVELAESAGADETPQTGVSIPSTADHARARRAVADDFLELAAEEGFSLPDDDAGADEPDGRLVETIIMEGDTVKIALGALAELDESGFPASEPADEADVADATGPEEWELTAAAPGAEGPAPRPSLPALPALPALPRWLDRRGTAIGVAALAMILAVQVLHQSREALATIPSIGDAVTPVYRILGRPIAPEWDVTGWRFEATRGHTDPANGVLTIVSRVGNESGDALPYPLLGVSLTDRYDEVIGSRVVLPGQYLPEDDDATRLVPEGGTFTATMIIEAPAPEAIGFKLNVCYREADDRLRCAVEDFR